MKHSPIGSMLIRGVPTKGLSWISVSTTHTINALLPLFTVGAYSCSAVLPKHALLINPYTECHVGLAVGWSYTFITPDHSD